MRQRGSLVVFFWLLLMGAEKVLHGFRPKETEMKFATWSLAFLLSALYVGLGARMGRAQALAAAPRSIVAEDASLNGEEDEDHPISSVLATTSKCDNCRRMRCNCVCGPQGRVWASAEYLYWWTKGQSIPTLVTSGSATDRIPGALGQPGTQTLLGHNIGGEGQSGGRFTAGFWLNQSQTQGVEASYFFLGSRTNSFMASGSGAPGSPVIARPFLDVTNPSAPFQNSQIISFPGAASGNIVVDSSTGLQGVGANCIHNLCCCSSPCNGRRIDLLGGFNWTQLNQSLFIDENIAVSAPQIIGVPTSAMFDVADSFGAKNNFYGAQVGLRGWWWRKRFFVNARGLVAFGGTHQQIIINGSTLITPTVGAPTFAPGGLLALPTNIGSFGRDQFSFIPQASINAGYQLTDHLRLFVGYTFMYWTNVVQPGHSIDQAVNVRQLPTGGLSGPLTGPARPMPLVKDTNFWAQGLNFGAMVQY